VADERRAGRDGDRQAKRMCHHETIGVASSSREKWSGVYMIVFLLVAVGTPCAPRRRASRHGRTRAGTRANRISAFNCGAGARARRAPDAVANHGKSAREIC